MDDEDTSRLDRLQQPRLQCIISLAAGRRARGVEWYASEADEREGDGRRELDGVRGAHGLPKFGRHLYASPHVLSNALCAEAPEHEPELESTEAAAKAELPVFEVDDRAAL